MLTPDKLVEVRNALRVLEDARNIVSDLQDGEPRIQPPSERLRVLGEIASELVVLAERLEELWS